MVRYFRNSGILKPASGVTLTDGSPTNEDVGDRITSAAQSAGPAGLRSSSRHARWAEVQRVIHAPATFVQGTSSWGDEMRPDNQHRIIFSDRYRRAVRVASPLFAAIVVFGFVSLVAIPKSGASTTTTKSCTPGPHRDLAGCDFANQNLMGKHLNHDNLTGVTSKTPT